ncbi:MAG: cob(I)yrinic acid a,c-diamide adenosyltransferase [Hydrogeniiclostridium sp.]
MEMLPFRSCIHIYHGDGKGKTTAAMGLALRALGAGIRPCVVQFLKTEASSERRALEVFSSKGLHLVPLPASMKFTFQMDKREKQEASSLCLSLLEEGLRLYTWEKGGLLILDEVLDAVNTGLLPEEELEEALRTLRPRRLTDGEGGPLGGDVILTGRNPSPALLEMADYITEMSARRHPYKEGLTARRGIEY